ncbi:unnamed protein product [Ascophyllum nodosum]
MDHQAAFSTEFNSTRRFVDQRSTEELLRNKETSAGATAGSGASGSYQLGLLFEAPVDFGVGRASHPSGAFDFVCSGSRAERGVKGEGCGQGEAVGFDRVCALRGKVVHIFTFSHETVNVSASNGTTASVSSPSRTTASTATLELGCSAERAAWNATASCVVVGDVSGRLHFITGEGTLLFSQQLTKPVLSAEERTSAPRAFHCIKFASTAGHGTGAGGAASNEQESGKGGVEEMLAVSASLHLFHFANVPLSELEAACRAQDAAALKKLRASISVSVGAAAESKLVGRADACLLSRGGGMSSRVFLVKGDLGVWRRERERGRWRSLNSGSRAAAAKAGGGSQGAVSNARSPRKLVQLDFVPAGELFGGGGAVSAQLSVCGRWLIVTDSRWGVSWWHAQSFLRLGRWTWPGDAFNPLDTVILESAAVGVSVDARMGSVTNTDPGGRTADVVDGGDPRPCVACISQRGEVRVLRLGGDGAEELFRSSPSAAAGLASAGGMSVLTVPSTTRHQFLLVTSEPATGKARFYLGKEAVPRHRLQALLTRGDYDQALELARAFGMDENDVHAARLLALLRAGGFVSSDGCGNGGQNLLPSGFYGDVKSLFGQLSSPGALGRACDAAVRAALPCLGDVRKLLEIVDDRLRSFDGVGARVQRLMLERLGAIFALLRTFELLEGGRDLSSSRSGGAPPLLVVGDGSGTCTVASTGDRQEDVDSREAAGEIAGGSEGDCSAFSEPPLRESGSSGGGGGGVDEETEVARWLQFRTTDLASFVGGALQVGDVQAAAVVWRRHGRTDRGAGRPVKRNTRTATAAGRGGESEEGAEGRRLEMVLPAQLATLPAGAPPTLLGTWLRDEVLPALDVAGALAIRDWATHHAREVEALSRRPHGALFFVRAVSEGSARVLGVAAQMMAIHSSELAAAEASASVITRGPTDHWKPWKRDSLDALESTLDDLTHAWDAHGLRLPLSTFERLPRDVVLFRVLDRVQNPEWLPEEISHHVMPMAKRYRLDLDTVLLEYMRICADAMVPRRANASTAAVSTLGGGGATATINSGLTTEQRAVAVARCMSAGEGRRSELRSKAVLALANAASFPFSDGLRTLVQDALTWGGALDEELQRAATALTLSQIVQRYHVVGFNLVDAPRATRLLRLHVLAQVHSPTALEDALQVAQAYSHLLETNVYVEFLQNLAGTYPRTAATIQGSPIGKVARDRAHGAFPGSGGLHGAGEGEVNACGGGRLALALETHRGRVTSALRRVPSEDARRVAEEVLLYLIRLLEDLELDAASSGLKPGQLQGCRIFAVTVTGAGNEAADTVVLDPGSEAEEAVLVTVAASAVVVFLREIKRHPGVSQRVGAVGDDLAAMANDLRRISTLQTELGAFASLVTLRRPRGRACWNVLREGLSALESHLHGDYQVTTSSDGSRRRFVPPASGKKGGVAKQAGRAAARTLPRLLHRARRLSELLGVPWASVVSHLANEAASRGKVPEAVGLCNMLFRDKAAMDERAAALALRDTAKALTTFVASQALSGALRTDGLAGDRARAAVFQAMAQSIRGLRQSSVLCSREELPLTLDLLQGSEAITAVLRRCEGGEELEVLTMPRFASCPTIVATTRRGGTARSSLSERGCDEDALSGLYKWYPGDGRVLPLEEALKLVCRFVGQEMQLRAALVAGEAGCASRHHPPSPSYPSPNAGVLSKTDASGSARWQPGLERATSPLLAFLEAMGAQQLCLRIVALMAMPPPSAVYVLGDSFAGLADKVLEFNHIDCPLAIGYMLALPMRQAYDAFRRTFRYSSDDYGRMRTLALVGLHAARLWDDHSLLHQFTEAERDAHWWHVLTNLGIPFDARRFSRADSAQVPADYHRSLVPALLERSGGDLALAMEFCDRYGVAEAFPCLLFIEAQLVMPCTTPHDVSYQARSCGKGERITEVLPAVHGLFLARMLRHMLDTAGIIDDRDYERLSFMHDLLLSNKCQSEEADCDEEIKRHEDSLEALAILKDYVSPWPVDADGMSIVDVDVDGAGGNAAKASTVGQASNKVYLRRLPFRALQKDPWKVLEPQLRATSVAKLVPLADPLGLSVGEFYSRLVKGMLNPGKLEDGTPGPAPVFSALRPWLDKINAPALACMTAQTVAVGMSRDVDRLEALRVAARHAFAARSLQNFEDNPQQDLEVTLTLLPETLPVAEGRSDLNETVSGDDLELEDVEHVAEGLETRAQRLENLMTAKKFLGREVAEQLQPFLSSSSQELLTKLLLFAAERAAEDALRPSPSTNNTAQDVHPGQASGTPKTSPNWTVSGVPASRSSMSRFRRRASRALRAANAVADQRGLDPYDLENVVMRLAKGWICQPRSGVGSSGDGGDGDRGSDRVDDVFIGGRVGGARHGESVFVADSREERMVEDAMLALRAAFVLTVTFSDEEDQEGGSGDVIVCDSIAYMDLKARISMLLAIAQDGRKDGRGIRVKFRARLRALLALSALAPSTLVAEVIASDKDSSLMADDEAGLSSLSDLRRNVGYMSELEEARLPHKLEELAACPAEDIVRALRRDHRRAARSAMRPIQRSLIPLMCDMLLDARSGDVGLWAPILADACRHADLRRVLILRVFPRVVRSTVADAFARSGEILAPYWEEALRSPLEELKARDDRRRKKEVAAQAVATVGTSSTLASAPAFPGVSSTSFGASLYAMASSSDAGTVGRGAKRLGAELGVGGGSRGGGTGSEWREEDVMAVVDQVVLMLGACPFPERLDIPWFSSTMAGLGSRFHKAAVRAALFIAKPATRINVVLETVEEGSVPVAVALDELRPVVDPGDGWCDAGLTNQAILKAVFLWIDRRGAYADLFDSRHFSTMASALVNAGRARGLVGSCLANGKRKEAFAVCRLYYQSKAASICNRDGAGVVEKEHEAMPPPAKKTDTILEKFAEEFGLELPCTDG